jgi:probable rRNA maturation factor
VTRPSGPGHDAIDVVVNAESAPDTPTELIERAVRRTLGDAGVREGEVSVTLLDDAAIRKLNREWLDRDGVTDVIAFSLGERGGPVLADVYLGWEQARRQARDLGVDPEEELVRLAVHGSLHVLGHDHPEGPERVQSVMFALQERLVRAVLAPEE